MISLHAGEIVAYPNSIEDNELQVWFFEDHALAPAPSINNIPLVNFDSISLEAKST